MNMIPGQPLKLETNFNGVLVWNIAFNVIKSTTRYVYNCYKVVGYRVDYNIPSTTKNKQILSIRMMTLFLL